MKKVQNETGVTLNIGVVNRFNKAVNQIKSLIAEGTLGDIYHVYVSFRAHRAIPGLGGDFTNKAVAGGGALIDWGVHYLDIVMYCLNDPKPLTVSAQAYSKLGVAMDKYVYEEMWAGPPKLDGVFDVDDSVTALVRTEGPTISLNGAWAQNIGVMERYIDFLGDKGGIRLMFGKDYTVYTTLDGKLFEYKPTCEEDTAVMFENEINAFVKCVQTGEKLPNHIDTVITTAEMMQAMYDSSDEKAEIKLG